MFKVGFLTRSKRRKPKKKKKRRRSNESEGVYIEAEKRSSVSLGVI